MRKTLKVILFMMLAILLLSPNVFCQEDGGESPTEGGNSNQATSQQVQQQSTSQIQYSTGGGVGFPVASGVGLPQLPYYLGIITPDGRYQKLYDVVQFRDFWTMTNAKALLDQDMGKLKTDFAYVGDQKYPASPRLIFIVHKPENQKELVAFRQSWEMIAIGNVYAKKGASSLKVMGAVIEAGLGFGADAIAYNEGTALKICANATGIGINNSLAVSGSTGGTNLGGVAAGGIGWTWAEAGYQSFPWLQVQYFKLKKGIRRPFVPPIFKDNKPAEKKVEDEFSNLEEGEKPPKVSKDVKVTTTKP